MLICITSDYSFERMSQVASAIYYAMNCWLSVETRAAQIIKIHREYPNFILARSVNSLARAVSKEQSWFEFYLPNSLPSARGLC